MKDALSVIAGLLAFIGIIPYIYGILREETKPAKASWIIWTVLDIIVLAGMFAKHAVNGQILGATIGAAVIAILALKYGVPGWTKLDRFCFAGAILGIVLWQAFSNPTLGIITSLSVAFIGSIPTFASAWKDPKRENKLAWTIAFISSICAIIAIPQWTLAHASQPVTFFIIQMIIVYILYTRPLSLVKA